MPRMNLNRSILSSFNLFHPLRISLRSSSKISVDLNKDVISKLEKEEIKPRHHPGIVKTSQIALPQNIIKAIIKCTGDYPVKTLIQEGQALSRYITARHPPPEESLMRQKITEIESEIDSKYTPPNFSAISEEEFENYKKNREGKIKKILKQRIIAWKSISYGPYEALLYAVARSAREYAVLLKTLKEISARDPTFQPRSYFDFGSGVGTGMWASSTIWKNTIFEYFNVDSSRDMNDLSDLILRDGNENQHSTLKNVFYRQFLPALENKYDLVVSAYSLFEQPSSRQRKEVLLNLWKKCDGYLVIVEEGTRHGFEIVIEARDYILDLKNESDVGHVFSPCPHDVSCPRLETDNKVPCNFGVSFLRLPIGDNAKPGSTLYSYVVLKKGTRDPSEENIWPRIVRPTLVRSKHTICRVCSSQGNLQEIIFTASKHGKFAYRCARSTRWGDRLPMLIDNNNKEEP